MGNNPSWDLMFVHRLHDYPKDWRGLVQDLVGVGIPQGMEEKRLGIDGVGRLDISLGR